MILLLLILTVAGFCYASPPVYQPPVLIHAAGEPIDTGFYAAPCITDWNGDGLKDLILGDGVPGAMRFYQNENTNDSPVFTAHSLLESDGTVIYHNYGAWGPINPQAADWNGDGLNDLLIGDCRGNVTYYRRTGPGINDLICEGFLNSADGCIEVGYNSAPVVTDWNSDGLPDLLVGCENSEQSLWIFLNTGSLSNPALGTGQAVQSSGSPVAHYRCCPQVIDMNGDGKKDLILGESDAHIYYYENSGSPAEPVFTGSEAVQSTESPIELYSETRLWVNDWNNDGIQDILVSDYYGMLYLYMAQNTGVEEERASASAYLISPEVNPSEGVFNINIHGAQGISEVTIYNSAGRTVLTTNTGEELVSINAGSLSTGVYTIVARNNGSVSSCRMVLTD